MTHITFIHGIANKPPKDRLLEHWLDALQKNDGPRLGREFTSASMLYWADVLYEAPEPFDKSIPKEFGARSDSRLPVDELDLLSGDVPLPETIPEDGKRFIDELTNKFHSSKAAKGYSALAQAPEVESVKDPGPQPKRIPLPWPIKRAFLKRFLRDVHHYLFNAQYSPRPGTAFDVQTEIRARVIDALSNVDGRHIIVSHSMGTVIAYDCLMRVPECPPVDGLMTIGSPLGIDEIQDKLRPEWSRENGFPSTKILGAWHNIYDALDVVAALDPDIANDYQQSGSPLIRDLHEPNHGTWRHDIAKYLGGRELRMKLSELSGIAS